MMRRNKPHRLIVLKVIVTTILSLMPAVLRTPAYLRQQHVAFPIEKEGLLKALRRKALTEKELTREITSRGVNFQLTTPAVESEIRQAGRYLGRRGVNNLIATVRDSFRPSSDDKSSPGGKRPDIYRVRVTIIDPQRRPVEEVKVWSTIGGEPKKVAGGWQFDIPSASVPVDGKVTFHASKETAFLTGERGIKLDRDANPVVTVELFRNVKEVIVRGIVLDEANNAIGEVRVNIVGYESELVITQPNGGFVLPAHAAVGQQVLLHAEKPGYKAVNQYHPAGEEPVTIILERR
jgi:hypothetical protein